MYLIEIDDETGLLSEAPTNTGWKAIKVFFDFYKKHGIKGMTAIALAADYQSPLRHYKNKDRFERACEEIFNDRYKFDYESEEMKTVIQKYNELQLDTDLETERINTEIRIRLLESISSANLANDDQGIEKYRKAMENHEKSESSFRARFNKKMVLEKAVTSNNYELSRIEADIKSRKKSKFVNHGEDIKNPDSLNLNN